MRFPSTFFLGFALFLVDSKSNVSAFFWLRFRMAWARFLCVFNGFQKQRFGIFPAAVSQWLGHKTCWGSAFSHALSNTFTFFLGFALFLYLFIFIIFNGFQKQRFGIFPAAVSQWLRHKTCWGSAFSHALPKHLFLWFALFLLIFSGFFKAMFRHFSGCSFAMAWAQNLLGLCFFACAPQAPFSWVLPCF